MDGCHMNNEEHGETGIEGRCKSVEDSLLF